MTQPEKKFLTQHQLPLCIESTASNATIDDLLDYVKSNKEDLHQDLLKYGGLLFRGFGTHQVQDFSKTIEALDLGQPVDYIGGGAPRIKVHDHVYTSTEAPPDIKIHLHNEMSYVQNFPKHIYFWCDIKAPVGGETFLGDARRIFKRVKPQVKEKLSAKGINYISRYYHKSKLMDFVNSIKRGHKSWIDVFETKDKKDVEKKCVENGFDFRWNQNNWLEISRKRPAFLDHPLTNDRVWFNQIHLFDYNPRFIGLWQYLAMRAFYVRKHMRVDEVFFADNSKISRKEIYHILDVLDEESIYYPWEKGDILVLDNILSMHGRAPFTGKRRVLTAMTA